MKSQRRYWKTIKTEESMRMVWKERMIRREIVEEFDRMVELELRGEIGRAHV